MTAEGAGDVVVLAVDVVGDGAADADELRAGRRRQEPAVRHGEVEDLSQRRARLAADDAGRRDRRR